MGKNMEEIIILKKTTYDGLKSDVELYRLSEYEATRKLGIARAVLFNAMLLTYKFDMYDLEKLLDFKSGASALSDIEALKKVGFTEDDLKLMVKEAYEKRT